MEDETVRSTGTSGTEVRSYLRTEGTSTRTYLRFLRSVSNAPVRTEKEHSTSSQVRSTPLPGVIRHI